MAITRKGKLSVNSISEMSWESARSILGGALNLKGGSKELKGPCPKCGGTDRFWIRPGHTLPFIFGCRSGCDYSQIIKELSDRGLVANEKLSKETINKFKLEGPVPYQLHLWALLVLDIVAEEGCEEDDMKTFSKAANVIKRAKRNGVTPMGRDFFWTHAELIEKGLIDDECI
jgi:hypothetical protein